MGGHACSRTHLLVVHLLHAPGPPSLQAEWPCLSFDIVRDDLGAPRTQFPHTMYLVAGTQAERSSQNYIAVIGLRGMGQAGHGPRPERRRPADRGRCVAQGVRYSVTPSPYHR